MELDEIVEIGESIEEAISFDFSCFEGKKIHSIFKVTISLEYLDLILTSFFN